MATVTPVERRFQEFKPVNFDLEMTSYRIVKAALSCLQTLINSLVPYLNQWVIAPLNHHFYGPAAPLPAPAPIASPPAATQKDSPRTPTDAVVVSRSDTIPEQSGWSFLNFFRWWA